MSRPRGSITLPSVALPSLQWKRRKSGSLMKNFRSSTENLPSLELPSRTGMPISRHQPTIFMLSIVIVDFSAVTERNDLLLSGLNFRFHESSPSSGKLKCFFFFPFRSTTRRLTVILLCVLIDFRYFFSLHFSLIHCASSVCSADLLFYSGLF
jgi:hypothetical protein